MTVQDAMNLVAPKLSQDEDIYTIGLAEAAGECLVQQSPSLFVERAS
jgi:hypothetical protein